MNMRKIGKMNCEHKGLYFKLNVVRTIIRQKSEKSVQSIIRYSDVQSGVKRVHDTWKNNLYENAWNKHRYTQTNQWSY